VECGCIQEGTPVYLPQYNQSDPDDPCFNGKTEKNVNTAVLEQAQEQAVNFMVFLGVALVALSVLVISTSKYYGDKNANYLTIIQNSLAVYDFTSDIAMLISLSTYDNLQDYFHFVLLAMLFCIGYSYLAGFVILSSEMKRKSSCVSYYKQNPIAVKLCFLLSPVKPNFILILDTRLFQKVPGVSNTFNAPLPRKMRTKYRIASLLHLVFEDVVQLSVILALQKYLLADWTVLNIISVSASASALVLSFVVTAYHLSRSYKQHVERGHSKVVGQNASTSGSEMSVKSDLEMATISGHSSVSL